MYHECMSETNEVGIWERVKRLIKPEVKPVTEAVLSNIIEHPRTRILRESAERQALAKRKTRVMNTAAAGVIGAAALGAGMIATGNAPRVEQAVSKVGQGVGDTFKAGVNRLRAGEEPIDTLQTKPAAEFKASRAPEGTVQPTPTKVPLWEQTATPPTPNADLGKDLLGKNPK